MGNLGLSVQEGTGGEQKGGAGKKKNWGGAAGELGPGPESITHLIFLVVLCVFFVFVLAALRSLRDLSFLTRD